MYLEIKNKAGIENDKNFNKKQSELKNKISAEFEIKFKNIDNKEVCHITSIGEILKSIGIILFTQWTAESLKQAIEIYHESIEGELKLKETSLSNILLKLLALKIIEPIGDLLEDEIELTELGKEIVLSFVEF